MLALLLYWNCLKSKGIIKGIIWNVKRNPYATWYDWRWHLFDIWYDWYEWCWSKVLFKSSICKIFYRAYHWSWKTLFVVLNRNIVYLFSSLQVLQKVLVRFFVKIVLRVFCKDCTKDCTKGILRDNSWPNVLLDNSISTCQAFWKIETLTLTFACNFYQW